MIIIGSFKDDDDDNVGDDDEDVDDGDDTDDDTDVDDKEIWWWGWGWFKYCIDWFDDDVDDDWYFIDKLHDCWFGCCCCWWMMNGFSISIFSQF